MPSIPAPQGPCVGSIYPTAPLAAVAPTVTSDGVTYLRDLSGRLHAVRSDGSVAWTRDLGGPGGAGLTTSAIPHQGWVYVGRGDGALVASRLRGGWGGAEPAHIQLLTESLAQFLC